jgi:hypothetical protein
MAIDLLEERVQELRLTDEERESLNGLAVFLCELSDFKVKEDTKIILREQAAKLRGLLERLGGLSGLPGNA